MSSGAGLGRRVLAGSAWLASGRMVVRGIGVVSTLVLVRLLSPDDFGVVAVAMALIATLEQATEFGFNSALIRLHDARREEYDTAWTLNATRGLVIALAILVAAGPLAAFLDDPRLAPVFAALALLPLLQGIENPRFVDFERELDFRPLAHLMVVAKLGAFPITLALAFWTRSYWALVAGMIASRVIRIVVMYWMKPTRPSVAISGWPRLLSFSGWIAGTSVIQAASQRLDAFVLKKFVTTDAVGLFYVAKELTMVPFQEVVTPIRRALFPGFREVLHDPDRLREAYLGAVSGVFLVVAPLCAGLALVAEEAVAVLLGANWAPAAPMMQMLALIPLVAVMGQQAIPAVMASGNTRLWFLHNLVYAPVRLVALIGGAWIGGVETAIQGLLLGSAIIAVLNMRMAGRVIDVSVLGHMLAIWRSLASLAIMALVVRALQIALPAGPGLASSAVVLIAAVLGGAVTYVGVHYALWVGSGRPWGAEARVLGLLRRRTATGTM